MTNKWAVEFDSEFLAEFGQFDLVVRRQTYALIRLLEAFGPTLGRPHVDTLKGSRHANMKEMRFSAADGVWRVAFAFDPQGDSVGGWRQVRGISNQVLSRSDCPGRPALRAPLEEPAKGVNGMGIPFEQVFAAESAETRAWVEQRAAELIAEELNLREMRRLRKLTQARLSRKLKIGQEGVSRIERRTDLYLSTLRSYVEAVGGKLSLVVEFPDRQPVLLAGLGEPEPPVRRGAKSAPANSGQKNASSRSATATSRKAAKPRKPASRPGRAA